MAAILILAIVSAAAIGASSAGLRAFRLAAPAASAAARALALDDGLRQAARMVRIPYWDRGARAEPLSPGLRVGYVEGRAEAYLSVAASERGLALSWGGETRLFGGIVLTGAQALPEGSGPPRGIAVDYRIGERGFRTETEFGAWALGEDGK